MQRQKNLNGEKKMPKGKKERGKAGQQGGIYKLEQAAGRKCAWCLWGYERTTVHNTSTPSLPFHYQKSGNDHLACKYTHGHRFADWVTFQNYLVAITRLKVYEIKSSGFIVIATIYSWYSTSRTTVLHTNTTWDDTDINKNRCV